MVFKQRIKIHKTVCYASENVMGNECYQGMFIIIEQKLNLNNN